MVRSLALGFGVVTALAIAGSMTPKGQAMFGFRHPAAETTAPVTVIQDKPAPIPAPAAAVQTQPATVPGTAQPPRAVPQAAPPSASAPAAQRPQGAPSAPGAPRPQGTPQGGLGGLAGVANILLNLPQVLDQTHVGPSHGSDSWSQPRSGDSKPARAQRKHVDGEDSSKDGGDSSH